MISHCMKRRRFQRRGLVLIVITILLMLISLGTMGLVTMIQTEYRAAKLRGSEIELENTSAAGRDYLGALATQSRASQASLGGLSENRDLFLNRAISVDSNPDSELRFSITPPGIPGGPEVTQTGPVNESSKLHLGQLLIWDKEYPGSGVQALMNLPGMTTEVADAILDWIDADSTPRSSGAEADRYSSLGLDYQPRNALPPLLEELLLVPGVTPELLLGETSPEGSSQTRRNRKSAAPSISNKNANFGSGNTRPWRDFLTVASRERNENQQGQPRIWLNQPDLVELHQQLTDRIGTNWANYVIAFRQFGPYRGRRGTTIDTWQPELNQPARFSYTSELELIGTRVPVVRENRSTKTVDSPLPAERVGWAGTLSRILDEVTVEKNPFLIGRVNIEMAPREVLIGIPGMDVVMVDRILSSRTLSADGSHTHAHPAWLLEQNIVELNLMTKLLPCLTTGGDVWAGEITAFASDYPQVIRDEFMIDAASSPPRQLYCKDLRDRPLPEPTQTTRPPGTEKTRSK